MHYDTHLKKDQQWKRFFVLPHILVQYDSKTCVSFYLFAPSGRKIDRESEGDTMRPKW